jgi:hypothetical protein
LESTARTDPDLWYNFVMPTPFTHLRLVAPFLANSLPGHAGTLLAAHLGPFLLGSTAPDVRTISPVSRQETHFYPIPPDPNHPAVGAMLTRWPSLADANAMPPDRAAFLAGYLAHLWFDEYWHSTIIYPYFVEQEDWGSQAERFNVYNVLLGYLDQRDRGVLDESITALLRVVRPSGWLPFVPDPDLMAWRDFLVDQLRPGGYSRTVEIMARRAHMNPAELQTLIGDQDRMVERIFCHIPRRIINKAYQDGRIGSARVMDDYLGGQFGHREPRASQPMSPGGP